MSRVAAAPVLFAAAVGVCALVATQWSRATTKPGRPPATTEGRLATRDGHRVVDVPLEHTEVAIHATGHLAEVRVEQTFRNPYDKKIEATYLFPLPTGAAVNDLELVVGDRVIDGEIAKRAAAKATYIKAKRAGFVAALLTQERPNLFTQHVANLEPGARVVVRMTYVQPLVYDAGGYELVFPMVAGPRYVPKGSAAAADADAVQAPVVPPDTRSSHDIGLTATIDAGLALRAVRSTSHAIVHTPGATAAQVTVALAPGDTIPNRDFVLRYDVAGDATAAALLAHRRGTAPGAFFLTVHPPGTDAPAAPSQVDAAPAAVTPREVVFVVDTSASMRGAPLAKARALVRSILTTLAPDDTFQIVRFADVAGALGANPIANKPANVTFALDWLDALEAGGGTEMTGGIAAALDVAHDPLRLRLVVFVTDGYVGNEDEILATVHAKLGASRLYSFGVGTAVNRYLLEEMASFGRGAAQIVRPDEDTAAVVATFHARIARPVLTDVTIDWGGLAVADVTPAALPDLFVGQPLVIAGRYAVPGAATVTVRGTAGGVPVELAVPVELPATADHPAIATVWARARIAELTRAEIRGATAETADEITRIALEHRLMSRYTAFVAVDRSTVTAGGDAVPVAVPVEVPAGLHATSGGGWGGGGMGMGAGGYGVLGVASASVSGHGASFGKATDSLEELSYEPGPVVLQSNASVRDRIDVAPTASPGDVRHEVQGKVAELKRRLKHKLKDKGAYKLSVTVGTDGSVRVVALEAKPSGDGAAALGDEILGEVRGWSFDAPAGNETTVDITVDGGAP
jgi:Ca-activated chloride channel family protein